jgi:hypothetical protein
MKAMKINVSEELKSRLAGAAANGSIVAADILAELRRNADVAEMIKGTANYFSTKRKKQNCESYNKVKVIFTACTKDITHPDFPDRNNPQAPWFPENRTDLEPGTLAGYFKNLPGYDDDALSYFANAICVNSRVQVKAYDRMQDFTDAYTEENYAGIAQFGESSLHNSCMRHEETARNAADFYRNFAGAKIIIAKDAAGSILGRAILWPNAVCKDGSRDVPVMVLDRVYFTHTFVIRLIYDYAKSIGVHLRKQKNDNDSPCELEALNDVGPLGLTAGDRSKNLHLYIPVACSKWHKRGAPYLDTFYHVIVGHNRRVLLSNKQTDGYIAGCRLTTGCADKDNRVCPYCGNVHDNTHELCGKCYAQIYRRTAFGTVMTCRTVEYKNEHYPSVLFKRGRPKAPLNLYFQVEKLYK